MNANEFWAMLLKKNKNGQPKYSVCTELDAPEDALMSAWINKWSEQFAYLDHVGCGCCVNIYEFDAPDEAIRELPADLIQVYEAVNPPPRTGSPSSFSQFFSQLTRPKNTR